MCSLRSGCALYVALAALALVAAPLSRGFPSTLGTRAAPAQNARNAAARTPQSFVVLAIGAVLTFYLAIGSVWTFASRAATEAGPIRSRPATYSRSQA